MNVDRGKFINDGFLIIRNCIPPEQLGRLRDSFEVLVERQKAIWARDRAPDDPPGGAWETSGQPRLSGYEKLIDSTTADTVEICLHENTMGVCKQLMRAAEAGAQNKMFMCSPVRDYGPASWHRDIHPVDQAPLRGLQMDLLENAPGYLQWNIPLYDDNVLWTVPGSHRRANTEAENKQLSENSQAPLPNSIPVEMKAGDGVVYTNTIFHWGSNYSTKLRRTIHLGYRSFGGPIFPYVCHFHRDLDFTRHLSTEARAVFERHAQLYREECDVMESTFRAIIDKNADAFREGLAAVHPGESGRIVCLILLSKVAYKMQFASHPARAAFGSDISQDIDLAPRFSPAELETLWKRFSTLDEAIQSHKEEYIPGFQSGPMRYSFEEMPTNFDVEDFIASWET
jgi:hypothetical protein